MSSSVFVHIVDDDEAVRESLGRDYEVFLHLSAADFLKVEPGIPQSTTVGGGDVIRSKFKHLDSLSHSCGRLNCA
jgi:hypothetical protein